MYVIFEFKFYFLYQRCNFLRYCLAFNFETSKYDQNIIRFSHIAFTHKHKRIITSALCRFTSYMDVCERLRWIKRTFQTTKNLHLRYLFSIYPCMSFIFTLLFNLFITSITYFGTSYIQHNTLTFSLEINEYMIRKWIRVVCVWVNVRRFSLVFKLHTIIIVYLFSPDRNT